MKQGPIRREIRRPGQHFFTPSLAFFLYNRKLVFYLAHPANDVVVMAP